jgi:uncharacterized membrane protein YidH (DUF202 family)
MVSAGQFAHRDPGLQPERTSLAWQRTAVSALLLSLVALGAASHRLVDPSGSSGGHPSVLPALAVVVTGTAALLAAVDAVVVVPASVHGFAHHPTSISAASPWTRLLLMMATTVLLSLGGGLLAVSGLVASVASSGA